MELIILILIILGFAFFARYFYLDYKRKKEKSFLMISLGVLTFWFFGGTGLLTIAAILIFLLLLKWCI